MTCLRHLVANDCCLFVAFLAQNEPPVLDAQYRNGVDSATNSFGSVVAWISSVTELKFSTQIHVNPTTASTLLKETHQPSGFFAASIV